VRPSPLLIACIIKVAFARVVVEDCVVYIYREFGCFFLFSTGSAARANQKKHKQAERQDRSHEPQAHFKVQISAKPDLLQN
jgi:hypothetical protein